MKMAAISRNLEQFFRNYALNSGTTQEMSPQNIIGISVTMLEPKQRFEHTFWIQRGRLQRYQKHIRTTIHVGPKY